MITSATVYFTWTPPASGHYWASARPVNANWSIAKRPTQVLVAKGLPPTFRPYGKKGGQYQPFETASGLFRELANVAPEPDAILAFADRYGPLTLGSLFVPVDLNRPFPKPPATCSLAHLELPTTKEWRDAVLWAGEWNMRGALSGDRLDRWQANIRALQVLVRLWDALKADSRKGIEKYAQLHKTDGRTSMVVIDETGNQLDEPIEFAPDNRDLSLQVAAEHALARAVDKRFSDSSAVSLYPPRSRHSRKLAIVPRTLEAGIWLQFALAIAEDKRFRDCEVCGRPFEISPQVARTNRTLCSNACKAKAHRHRREQALELAAKGLTPRQIAKQVGSQLSTVQKWLGERKR
jgi:hypothetical protein